MRSVDLTRPVDSTSRPRRPTAVHRVRRAARPAPLDHPAGSVSRAARETVLTWRVRPARTSPSRRTRSGPRRCPLSFGATAGLRTTDVASGPVLRVARADPLRRTTSLRARWLTSDQPTPGYLECLCSHFGTWALGPADRRRNGRRGDDVRAAAARYDRGQTCCCRGWRPCPTCRCRRARDRRRPGRDRDRPGHRVDLDVRHRLIRPTAGRHRLADAAPRPGPAEGLPGPGGPDLVDQPPRPLTLPR